MKIPTTPPSGTPYYHGPPVNGMEMNPQWQGNGMVIEGGAPGNGAAYILPHHVHPAGFVPPPGYYAPGASPPGPPAAVSQDFSEYMWMENEEEFDKQVMQQLEEEALMEQCIEAMLADEREAQCRMDLNMEEQISKSTLNPLAAEFVPTFSGSPAVVPGTSDQDPQPGLSAVPTNVPKSVESSMSELSISQASDALTDSSKSSTAEIAEELCNLPLDSSEKTKEDVEKKKSSIDTMPVVSANVGDSPIPTEALTKESEESSQDSKPAECVLKPIKPQEEVQVKKPETKSSTGKGGVPKSSKPKESEPKPIVSTEAPSVENLPALPTPNAAESDKVPAVSTPSGAPAPVAPSVPAVFNYAAAARANLPPKSTPTTPATVLPAAPTPNAAPKQDSVPKETTPQPTVSAAAAVSSKPQLKPGPKQSKPSKETKDTKTGSNFAKGPNGAKKTTVKK